MGQTKLFALTVLTGFAIGFIFDIFRVLRIEFRHPSFLIQAEDVLFWSLASFIMFYFLLMLNHGEVRVFLLMGAGLGALLYFYTASPLAVRALSLIADILKEIAALTLKILLAPLRLLLALARRFLCPLVKNVINLLKKLLKKNDIYERIKSVPINKTLKKKAVPERERTYERRKKARKRAH